LEEAVITGKMLLKYIEENAPVPYIYICRHFGVRTARISAQMFRLRKQGLVRRVTPAGEGPLWIITESGARRLNFYEQQAGASTRARAKVG